jgi:hypothetical protein
MQRLRIGLLILGGATVTLPLTGCATYSTAKALPKPELNCLNRVGSSYINGTVHWQTPFGYFFGSLSELHPRHSHRYRNQHFSLLTNGHQGNWNWKIRISRALRYDEKRCSFSNRNSSKYWDQSFFMLRSKVADILRTKTPGLNLHVYLVSRRTQLKIIVRRFSFSSIPLTYYFNAAIHVHKNGHCVMRFPTNPIDVVAHELVHALNDTGLIPRAPNLVTEETRAYLFDRLVFCTYPSPKYPCRPLKFYDGWNPRHDSWLLELPDQLARVVAAKATQKRFGSPLYLANGSLIYDAYSRWVGKMMLNPSALEPIIKATKRQYLHGHKFSLPRQCR